MAQENGPIGQQELLNRVYKGPNKSGDNIDGLVMLDYYWDGSNWQRKPLGSGTASTTNTTNQQTVNTTAVQVSASATTATNGILIGGFSTNGASIFYGQSSVTTSTGAELQPGQVLPWTDVLSNLYIISVASTTDKIWYQVL